MMMMMMMVSTGWTGWTLLPSVVPKIRLMQTGGEGVQLWSLTRQSLPYVNFKVTVVEFDLQFASKGCSGQFEENTPHLTV